MNLGLNARDAMPNGGTIRVGTENLVLGREAAGNPAPGNYVEITSRIRGRGSTLPCCRTSSSRS